MIGVEDLFLRYRQGGEELFGGLNHTFAGGSVTAVTGPSGRGKSTLLYVLGLMLKPTRGRVILDETPVSEWNDDARSSVRAQTIGFVFQDAVLDTARTALDAVIEPALYAGRTRQEVAPNAIALLERLEVGHRAHHRPGEISGGQAQRVAVCRALINRPKVVLADEPTGNLDRANASTVLEALRWASAESTVVIATHDPFVVGYADTVLEL